jgi:hypothetical protein
MFTCHSGQGNRTHRVPTSSRCSKLIIRGKWASLLRPRLARPRPDARALRFVRPFEAGL